MWRVLEPRDVHDEDVVAGGVVRTNRRVVAISRRPKVIRLYATQSTEVSDAHAT